MDDDDFGTDADFLAALEASEASSAPRKPVQPTPQRLDKPPDSFSRTATAPRVVQPIPQALPTRSAGSSILVSTRQKGNPILSHLRSLPWEYSDIPADYVLGLTTCALFLSLKYHRLHPEYIYNRIKALHGKYNLRVLLTLVDIGNHEDSLKELSKTSLINNVTVILCWSSAEAARYLELYKSYEHANPTAIRSHQSTTYADKLVDFITVPRSINKTDAVSIVSAFGSVRAAVNARPEEIAVVSGWGEKKVKRWCDVVQEPFRVRKAARRHLGLRSETTGETDGVVATPDVMEAAVPLSRVPLREVTSIDDSMPVEDSRTQGLSGSEKENGKEVDKAFQMWDPDEDDDEEALIAAAVEEAENQAKEKRKEQARKDNELSDGIAAALAKLRKE
jgi:DNA excision repair protein ERCC-1